MKACIIILLALVLSASYGEIVYVTEIARHGARAPGAIYNFTVDPQDNFKEKNQLTKEGMRQHQMIGEDIRKKYKVPETLQEIDILKIFSSDSDRTYESGLSQLLGIYPPELCTQTLNSFQMKNAVPPFKIDNKEKIIDELGEKALPNCLDLKPIFSEKDDINFISHFEKSKCKSYTEMRKKLGKSEEYKELIKPLVDYLDPRLHELTKLKKIFTIEEIGDLCSYIYISDFHNKKLVFEYNQTDIDMCTNMIKSKMFYISNGNDFLWKIGAKEFYEALTKSFDDVISGKKKVKLTLHFSHDYMLSILLNGLGEPYNDFILFASNLFFELHKIDNEFYVRTLYNQKPQKFGECKEELCKYSTFKKYILSIHYSGDIQKLCNNTSLDLLLSSSNSHKFLEKPSSSQENSGLWNFFKNVDYETLIKFLIFALVFMFIGYALAKARQKKRNEEKLKEEYFSNLLKYHRMPLQEKEESKHELKSMV